MFNFEENSTKSEIKFEIIKKIGVLSKSTLGRATPSALRTAARSPKSTPSALRPYGV